MAIVIYCVMIAFYFWWEGRDEWSVSTFLAIAVCGGTLIFYVLIPPYPGVSTNRLGLLYGFVPLLSLGAILFPHLNSQSPEVVTRTLGWGGLVTVTILLGVFKFYVW